MVGKTVTRADLTDAVHREIGLSRHESAKLVEALLGMISDRLTAGESVKLSSFGSFLLRDKNSRMGRNPKTGEEVPIESRRVLIFKPSQGFRNRVDKALSRQD